MFFVCFLIFSSKYIKIKCDTTKLNVLLEINFLKHSIITCKNIKDWHRHNLQSYDFKCLYKSDNQIKYRYSFNFHDFIRIFNAK